ncbi:condensin complex subunit 1, partial [Tanacetum coccineum]
LYKYNESIYTASAMVHLVNLQVSALWDYFCFNVSGTSDERSRGALSVLCIAAKSSANVLSSHLHDIIDIGFGRWAKVEPLLARIACIALQRLYVDDQKNLLTSHGSKVFGVLDSLITGS